MISRSARFIIIICSLALITAVPALAAIQAFAARFDANQFLADVKRLRVGKSSLADLNTLAVKYRSYSTPDSIECDQKLCKIFFYFGNRWLWRVGLSPASRFGGGITAREGTISEIDLALVTDSAYSASVVEVLATPNSTPYKVEGRRALSGATDFTMTVRLTSAASEELRRKAYNFNLTCLTRLDGCKNARLMLPGAW